MLVVATPQAGAAPPRVRADFFGMNALPPHGAPQQFASHAQAIRAAGMKSLRVSIPWRAVQPNGPTDANWQWVDLQMEAIARNGMTPFGFLAYGTPWAMREDDRINAAMANVPEDDLAYYRPQPEFFAEWARKVVDRYGRGGRFWSERPELPYAPITEIEVWNEPNMDWAFRPMALPKTYGALYRAARTAMRWEDPAIRVYVGGLMPNVADQSNAIGSVRFLEEMADPGAIDGVAVHAYGTTVESITARFAPIRAWMDAHGLASRPMTLTEWGWPANPPATSGLRDDGPTSPRAQLFAGVADELSRSDCGITSLQPFVWVGAHSSDHQPGWAQGHSLASDDGLTPTSAGAAFGAVASRQGGAADNARRATIHHCNRAAPDQDGDGIEDQHDYAPLDSGVIASSKGSAPSPYEPPIVSGEYVVGRRLESTVGTWNGAPLPELSIGRWEHCKTDLTDCRALPGGTGLTIPREAAGRVIRSVAAAQNGYGRAESRSAAGPVVGTAPFWTRPPVLNGDARVGKVMWLDTGDYVAIPDLNRAERRWQSCLGTQCRMLWDARNSYVPRADDIGRKIKVTLEFGNVWGSASVTLTSLTVDP